MSVPTKIVGLFAALRREDLDELSPTRREEFAMLCEHWAQEAKRGRAVPMPKSGVLAALKAWQGRGGAQ